MIRIPRARTPHAMRTLLKRAVETSLARTGLSRLSMQGRQPTLLVLLYHNVVPDSYAVQGEAALHVRQSDFLAQVECAEREFGIVSLREGLANTISRPRVAITFDDAYRGAVNIGIPELIKRGYPSSLFVAPGILDAESMWWDRYASQLGTVHGGLTFRARALAETQADGPGVDQLAATLGIEPNPVGPLESIASESDVRGLAKHELVTIASHSWDHRNLAVLGPGVLQEQFNRPLAWFRERGLPVQPWLAYPFGLHSDFASAQAVQAGYTGAFLAEGGWLFADRRPSVLAIPRLSIPRGVSRDGFLLRLHGTIGS